jgi:serine/threonine protein kinase
MTLVGWTGPEVSDLTICGVMTASQRSEWMVPDSFGQYKLIEMIGRGGMGGEVWKAFDTYRKRLVALKLLAPSVSSNPELVARFRHECHLAARITHQMCCPF